jgi:transglutaminase-like putative cysteine protease
LRYRRGHCNAQADLFRALLEVAGIDARLRFVKLDKLVLRHAVPGPVFMLLPAMLFHAVTEVNVGGEWLCTDSYIFQPDVLYQQKDKLKSSGLSIGFGLTEEATCDWDGKKSAFSQANKEDIRCSNETYSCLEAAIAKKAGNNRLLGIHFNHWFGCIPDVWHQVFERYLNSKINSM